MSRVLVTPIDDICDELRRRVPADEADLIETFARLFFAAAAPEFFRDRATGTLASLALAAFRHLQGSRPDRADVLVTAPETDAEPWSAPVTVIRTNVTERPFIVTTIREYLYARDIDVERFLHPVLQVVRDAQGHVTDLGPASAGAPLESVVHCEVPALGGAEELEEVSAGIRSNLEDAIAATDDFAPMVKELTDTIGSLEAVAGRLPDRESEIDEVDDFLRWLRPNFVFLGYDAWGQVEAPDGALKPATEPGLGLARPAIRDRFEAPLLPPVPAAPAEPEAPRWPPRLLTVTQTDVESSVHRRVRMHCITVRTLEAGGRVIGERRFLGLFRSRAYAEEAEQIPILRHKLRMVVEQAGWREGAHDQREAVKIFNSMPKEELFLATAVEIRQEIEAILAQYYTHDVKATLRPDASGRAVSIMVIMPRDRYSGKVRRALQAELVRELDGTLLNYNLVMGGGEQARLHFQVAAAEDRLAALSPEQVENVVHELIQTWTDQLERRLARLLPPEEARRSAGRWGAAFSPEYQAANTPDEAIADLTAIEDMEVGDRTVDLRLSNRRAGQDEEEEGFTRLNVYVRGERLVLSDFMPILENVGLRVLSMSPFEATDDEGGARIYTFSVQDEARRPLDLEPRGTLLADAILAVAAGDATNDPLNGLVLSAGLHWREIDVLRAYCEYAFQLKLVPARQLLPRALREYPESARMFLRIFTERFDPAGAAATDEGNARAAAARAEFIATLEHVGSLMDDRALRRLLALLDATVRTNYFVHGGRFATKRAGGAPYISLKILSELLQPLVPTRLRAEVWVQSARMAGIHMRGGKIARGGLRHSDRPDDLRTEVHGLVRTQSVKNAVIVPAGSKGGFVTRRRPQDPKELAAEVEAQYRTFISGLLDVTDNLADNRIVRPPELVVHDEPDPYLVVAADKGTATFSDVANSVAAEYGFWLDDAFASGGSNGYDHKGVGITARGAWECVRRHFRELGRDTQTEPLTVIGIGDMSGDVFGNGMLLSREIRLIAAFDHRHIFVDPAPDAAASYGERERLFRMGRSSWADYDRSLLSEGGFIVPRGIKEITLSAEAAAALGVAEGGERMDGETLIRTILSAPVDLLWNGGIGTYVKAPAERHADAGDSANDAVRIDATELRCKVLGEGGNLGLTQQARVCFALEGGLCYTDAIDNSGGVEMSDREVNLKILLNGAVNDGVLDREGRNTLLHELTDAVTEKVLHDNRSQSLAVSLDVLRAADGFEDFHGLMLSFEQRSVMGRAAEALPSLEVLVDRRAHGRSLTKPELSVLLAYAKLTLKQSLLGGAVPDDPAMERYLRTYFPERAVEVAGPLPLAGHRLRREIIATQLANDMIDLMGVSFIHRVTRDTGRSESAVARAWFIAASLAGAAELRQRLAGIEGDLPSAVIYRWLLGLARVLERTTRWILANVADDAPIDDVIGQHLDGITRLRRDFHDIVTGPERALYESLASEASELTRREDLAASLITLRFLDQLLGILKVARETDADPTRVGRAYYLMAELLALPDLRQAVTDAAGASRWDHRAAQALIEDIARVHRLLTAQVVAADDASADIEDLVSDLAARRGAALQAYRDILADLSLEERPSLAALIIAARELEVLAEG
jgi:glutamate dehydrogenase